MTKSEKLRLYEQKDYTELIEFPVELVGKDGIVRRYTYEESILVYQKRIESAHQRYRDREVAAAEVDHCVKRIDQIRRSWRVVCARRVASGADYGANYEEHAAAECRAFVREFFGKALADRVSADEEPIPIYLAPVHQEGPLKVFHVSLSNRRGGYLLYAFTFAWEPTEAEQGKPRSGERSAREQYTEWARLLATAPPAEDVESLLAAREGKDFGFLLTGPTGQGSPSPVPDGDSALVPRGPGKKGAIARNRIQGLIDDDPSNPEARYAMAVLLHGEGDPTGALEELKVCVELSPFHLDAYRMLASLGEQVGRLEEVEAYLLQGRHYFPEDARLHADLGRLRIRQARYLEAEESLDRAVTLDGADRRSGDLLRVLKRARRYGMDPALMIARLEAPPGLAPGNLPLLAAAFGASIALTVRILDPLWGTMLLAATMATVSLHGARLRSRSLKSG